MEPFSLASGVLTVAHLAVKTLQSINKLNEQFKNMPGRLQSLNNEVADLGIVLNQVAVMLQTRETALESTSDGKSQHSQITEAVDRIQRLLRELQGIVSFIEAAGDVPSKLAAVHRVRVYRRHLGRLGEIQAQITESKSSLNLILGATNSQDMMRIRLDLIEFSSMATASARNQSLNNSQLRDTLDDMLSQIVQHVDDRIETVRTVIEEQSKRHENAQKALIRPGDPPLRSRQSSPGPTGKHGFNMQRDSVGIVVRASPQCKRRCRCSCHKSQRAATPSLFNRVLGQLFVEYAGVPVVSGRCDSRVCQRAQNLQVSVEYWFPMAVFWSKIVQLQINYMANFGPSFQLQTLRRVPDSAPAINFAMGGNIEGLQDLFRRGLASPQDIGDTRGYSLLRWALYSQQFKTARFLYFAGADPEYRPKAASDNNPRNKAADFLLQGFLPSEAADDIVAIANKDWIEEQNFPLLHRIVTGLHGKDLTEALMEFPETINDQDTTGRTALLWAAIRGDEHSLVSLLAYGADPNIMDIELTGPLSYAANRNHAVCVRILLEAGAEPDPVLPGGYKVGSPLNVASRNASDPMVLKTLLDFGADVDACGVDKRTPLLHAARTDNAPFALVLLEHNANINAIATNGQTPLITAITNNSHQVLQLLLDRWADFSTCPRLQGPHLLRTVATYADIETLAILSLTDHFRIRFDREYSTGDFDVLLSERYDADDKLKLAFDDFMAIIKDEASEEDLMEKGAVFQHYLDELKISDDPVYAESEGSEDVFHDAVPILAA